MKTAGQPGRGIAVKIPADRIGSVSVQRLKGVDGISLGFRHFLSVLILHQSQNDYIAVRSLVKQKSGNCQQ